MEMSRQEYPALLTSLQPEQAIDVLNDRVALINKINLDIADFLQERRRIEERYAADLHKLARRPHADNATALGVFDMPWQRIVSSTENLAQSHESLASKIETDVEGPLKQYATKSREMQAITTIQGNINSIAKDLARAREKADKLSAKGGRKAGDASSSRDDAAREWESQSPYVFEQFQALDENRVNHLRDVLTQFQTHELDQLEKGRSSAEACLNALLNVETADEIKTFAAKVTQGGVTTRPQRRSSVAADNRPISSTGNLPPAPPPPRNSDLRQNSASNQDRLTPLPEATPSKSKMGGLKRLGTVMRGKKGAAPPPPQSASEKKKEKTRSFAPFRRGDSSRSFHDLEESGQDLTPVTTGQERAGSSQGPPTVERVSLPSPRLDLTAPAELNGLPTPHVDTSKELPIPAGMISNQATVPNQQQQQQQQYQLPVLTNQASTSDGEVFGFTSTEQTSPSPLTEESTRNLKIRDQPIHEDASEAQLAMNNMATQLRMQAQSSGMSRPQGSVRGRRDVRNTMFVPSGTEVPGLSNSPGLGAVPTPPTSTNPVPASTATAVNQASPIASPIPRTSTTGMLSEEQAAGSDAGSIHSSHALGSMAQHPELSEPGLNASIVETVNTWFSEAGITRSFVVGEVAFSHITSSMDTVKDIEVIRLQNFQVLEKVAANPTFITAPKTTGTSEEQAGIYNVALPSIRRPSPTVGLKYQLHLDEANVALYSPLLISPAWQILEGQTSVILLYGLNPAFTLPPAMASIGELTLKNVAISIGLDITDPTSGKAASAMMAPTQGASFRRRASSVIWRFPELKIKPGQERLLVRFMTEGGLAKKGSVSIKFEAPDMAAGGLGVEKLGAAAHPETDPFADEQEVRKSGEGAAENWDLVPTRRMLMSGKYVTV